MADNTTIGTGVSPGTAIISSDDVGGGVQVQRVKVQHGPDGSATDASSAAPLPTTDAAVKTAVDTLRTSVETLDLQMGAAPAQTGDVQSVRDRLPAALVSGGLAVTPTGTVTVDTELAAPFAAADADASASAPLVVARAQRFNGATFERERSSTASAVSLLASADRTGASTFAFPSIRTYNCSGLMVYLSVTGIGAGNLVIVLKAIGSNATLAALTCTPATFTGATAGNPVDAGLILAPGATLANATAAYNPAGVRFGFVGVPGVAPGTVTGYTQHVDTTATWTYSLSCHLIA
jgi:hypothetical protein